MTTLGVRTPLLGLLVLTTLFLAGKALVDPPWADAPALASTADPVVAPPSVLFVGGALSAGGADSPAEEAAGTVGLLADVRDHGDTGILATGTDGTPPIARAVPQDVDDPDVDGLVVQGDARDLGAPPETVKQAALHMVDRLRVTVSPTTRLVLLAPLPPLAGDPPGAAAVRAALREAAREKQVHFADPVTDGWLLPAGVGELEATEQRVAFTAGLVEFLTRLNITSS